VLGLAQLGTLRVILCNILVLVLTGSENLSGPTNSPLSFN